MSKNHSRTVSIDTPNHSSRRPHAGGRTEPGRRLCRFAPAFAPHGSQPFSGETVALAGLTFQQIQKYEHGMNRIGASRLYDFAQILDVPVSFFFAEMPEEVAQRSPRPLQRRQLL